MAIKLPRLQRTVSLVDKDGCPTQTFHQWWATVAKTLEDSIADLQTVATAAADAAEAASGAATAAADAATAAATAATAAATAQSAADTAQAAADGIASEGNLVNSWVDGGTVTATDAGATATINISAHTRVYGDGFSVAVNGGAVTTLAFGTQYYVYYDDPTRAGGAVTYVATTDYTVATQTGSRHVVGGVTTPADGAANTSGYVTYPPGAGNIYIPGF